MLGLFHFGVMRKLLLIIFIIFNLSFTAFAVDCSNLGDSCSYYKCEEINRRCGDKGYLIRFGLKYCEKIKSKENRFSTDGKIWMNETRRCLISKVMEIDSMISCRNLKKEAFKSHGPCYVNNGYCTLSKSDKKVILSLIKGQIFNFKTWLAGIRVLSSCSKE